METARRPRFDRLFHADHMIRRLAAQGYPKTNLPLSARSEVRCFWDVRRHRKPRRSLTKATRKQTALEFSFFRPVGFGDWQCEESHYLSDSLQDWEGVSVPG